MNLKEMAEKAQEVLKGYPVKVDEDNRLDWLLLKLQEEMGEFTQAYLKMTHRARLKGESSEELKEKFAEEIADLLGFLLLISKETNTDMEKAIQKKWFSLLER